MYSIFQFKIQVHVLLVINQLWFNKSLIIISIYTYNINKEYASNVR